MENLMISFKLWDISDTHWASSEYQSYPILLKMSAISSFCVDYRSAFLIVYLFSYLF